jgi:hypothetical protein
MPTDHRRGGPRARPAALLVLALASLAACSGSADARPRADARGRSSELVRLAPARQAAAYEAALRTSFDLRPELLLVLDPVKLPAAGGYDDGGAVAPELAAALVAAGTVRASCAPVRGDAARAPRCDIPAAGYAVRVSDAFRAGGDTLRLFLTAERVQPTADSSFVKAFAFEGRYLLVPSESGWRVVRAARKMIS